MCRDADRLELDPLGPLEAEPFEPFPSPAGPLELEPLSPTPPHPHDQGRDALVVPDSQDLPRGG